MRLTDAQLRLFTDHIDIAHKIARRLGHDNKVYHNYDDCLSHLLFALYRCALLYDPDKGMSFKNYAWNRLKLAYIEFLRIPYRQRNPTGMVGIELDKYIGDEDTDKILAPKMRQGLHRPLPGHSRQSTIEKTSHTDTYEGLHVWDLLRNSPARDRFVLYYVLVLGFSHEEVGKMLNVSGGRAWQIYRRAIYRLFDPTVTESKRH